MAPHDRHVLRSAPSVDVRIVIALELTRHGAVHHAGDGACAHVGFMHGCDLVCVGVGSGADSSCRLHLQVELLRLSHLVHSSAALVSHFEIESAELLLDNLDTQRA